MVTHQSPEPPNPGTWCLGVPKTQPMASAVPPQTWWCVSDHNSFWIFKSFNSTEAGSDLLSDHTVPAAQELQTPKLGCI